VSVVNIQACGRGSGVEVEHRQPAVWTIREGKIIRVVFYAMREEALEAAGLSD
jgi:ketosteroid isomerase-like protein